MNAGRPPQRGTRPAADALAGLSQLDLLQAELAGPWRLCGFRAPALEQRYNDEMRPRRARQRTIMFAIALVVFATAPFYGPALLHTPAAVTRLFRLVEFAGIVPLSALGLWFNLRWPTRAWVSTYTLLASAAIVVLLIVLRYAGLSHGFVIPFEMLAIAVIVISVLSGLRTWRIFALLGVAATALLGMELYTLGVAPRFWWSVVAAAVTFAFAVAAEIAMDVATRRAWVMGQLAELSGMRDSLTGLPNRAWFERDAERLLAHARREHTPVAVILFDVDHFKPLNDTLGHAAGDDCLRRIGRLLLERYAQRALDLRARVGGEEFALLLCSSDRDGALQTAEQLVRDVRALMIANPGAPGLGIVTVSAGVVHAVPAPDEDIWQLMSRADQRLYEAKRAGRNRWCG